MSLSRLSASSSTILQDLVVRRYLGIAVAATALDLMTKEAAVRLLGNTGFVTITDRLSFTLVWNTGTAGGLMLGPGTWLLNVLMTVLALGLVLSVVRPMAAVDPRATMAMGLVSGGAIGNLLSMVAGPHGVADFIGVRLTEDTTMVANVADLFLWSGSLLLVPVGMTLYRLAKLERAQRAVPNSKAKLA
ncbi:signal peptidase II [Gemmatimonas sp.]|jgi:lipoprotein signal peptidase|uniref:signal peptidase II n=1 Tax=Gemmatimonas sp. TaxID=1962908 RepID=UPI0031CB374D|nr:signal peptidase II [Gemmatimonas sp.]